MSYSIVVADDSLFARMLVKEAVLQIFDDCKFFECTSGQGAIDKYEESSDIDWFLLDVNMGEPNGFDTAKILHEKGVPIQNITLLTGNRACELQEKSDEIGLSCINKAIGPKDVEDFVARLRAFFENASIKD